MTFRVGQKVVCIAKREDWHRWREGFPEYQRIYTLADIQYLRGYTLFRLAEIMIDTFETKAFRPVVEKSTDISIFTAMLNRAPERIDA